MSDRQSRAKLIPGPWVPAVAAFLAILIAVALDMTPEPPPPIPPMPADLDDARALREIAKLDIELHLFSRFLQFVPIAVVVLGAALTYHFSRRLNERQAAAALEAERFSLLAPDRVQAYADVFARLAPTALFFPPTDPPTVPTSDAKEGAPPASASVPLATPASEPIRSGGTAEMRLTREHCRHMGAELSRWYFGRGGLLMGKDAQTSYFALLEGLRLAAMAKHELVTPTNKEHSEEMSAILVRQYRSELAELKGTQFEVFEKLAPGLTVKDVDLASYRFGEHKEGASPAERFTDFVLIQQLASRFRTALTEDIRSRKPPEPAPENAAARDGVALSSASPGTNRPERPDAP